MDELRKIGDSLINKVVGEFDDSNNSVSFRFKSFSGDNIVITIKIDKRDLRVVPKNKIKITPPKFSALNIVTDFDDLQRNIRIHLRSLLDLKYTSEQSNLKTHPKSAAEQAAQPSDLPGFGEAAPQPNFGFEEAAPQAEGFGFEGEPEGQPPLQAEGFGFDPGEPDSTNQQPLYDIHHAELDLPTEETQVPVQSTETTPYVYSPIDPISFLNSGKAAQPPPLPPRIYTPPIKFDRNPEIPV